MSVLKLKPGEEVKMKDPLNPDLVYVSGCRDPETVLKVEMSKYQGGSANQVTSDLLIEQGQYIDCFKMKDNSNLETKDFIIRKIVATKRISKATITGLSGIG